MDTILKEHLSKMLAICLTPMTPDQRPDPAALRRHLRWMVQRGGLDETNSMMIVNGSTAEAHSLSLDERKALLDAARAEIGGGRQVIVGCQHTDVNAVVELMRHAERAGAACGMVLPPYYYAATADTVVEFYARVTDGCGLGMVIYNNLSASGIDIPVAVYERLLDRAHIVGVKECTNTFTKMEEVAALLSERMVIISGHGIVYEPYAAIAGAQTFNSSEACFLPRYARRVWEARRAKDYVAVKRMRDALRPYFHLVSEVSATDGPNGVISLIKHLTDVAGSYMGPGKTPVPALSQEYRNKAEEVYRTLAAKEAEL